MSDRDERVEELESKVEQLEATVQGLTEELVEVNDRLETLEGDESAPAVDETADPTRTREDKTDGAKSDESNKEDETGEESGLGDDIIVA